MRRVSTIAAALAGALVTVAACSGAIDTGTGKTAATDAPAAGAPAACQAEGAHIAVLLPNQTNPYYVAMKKGFEEAAQENGMEAQVQIAGDDDAQQLAQAEAALQKKPCALALNPVKSEPAAAIVRAANDAGVPVFTVNIGVDPQALEAQGATVVQYLGADNKAGGELIAEQMLKDLGADAKLEIGFVTEPDEVPVVIRDEGFAEAIKANPNAQVAAQVDGNVKAPESLNVTSDMLQGNPNMNAIFASTGPATQGALEAVTTSGRDVKVYGFCAPEVPLTAQYPACVAQEPEDYGRRTVAEIVKYAKGEKVEAEILRPLKLFVTGQTPGPGEVG
ncbi:substrate-binding domain-containing protein [Buchananella hordeovulneris]|uniref:substrate-binding domain-containing protein n=1 Tax=Buchananella hordeovulneris TaxID=52770 RepID=UPI000F5F235C|nr:substrate-binding domain-containing protein [Buchananella hordeovulneris]RRD43032.1 sugar ABC transporter substrate-binding protein [Buchananella hordeovulneris]